MAKKNRKKSTSNENPNGPIKDAVHIKEMYGDWFLEYASYVILERAVPALGDGLKPVQRRILHAMKQMDDGRFHKAANVIGQTMQFHPHGDAAIGEALVNLGQKELMIETQGNWGDILTGDRAAAPRYIEARLSKFALEVAFNANTTEWQRSYDGRKKEPVALPMKFPLLLAQGVDGIAVGLATKIMPHNFVELIEAAIAVLRRKESDLLPDFPTGGLVDTRHYNEGRRGGRLRVRARIEITDKKKLVIRDIPFGTTTTSLMESIVKANDNGKIKIKSVVDNTSKEVEIVIELPPGVSPDVTVDALYAFTDCEISLSPNACVIVDEKPVFMGVNEILKYSIRNTVSLLKQELEIRRHELMERWHFSSLEKIFIEKRIYRQIEESETWEAALQAIDKGLRPFKKRFQRKVTEDDIVRLTEIKIKRISKYNVFEANREIKSTEEKIAQVEHDLVHLTDYGIAYFETLLEKYGQGQERKSEIRSFDTVKVSQVAVDNQKLYVSRQDGFIGYGIKKEEYVCDCSDLDDIIVFLKNGTFLVTKVMEKKFVGKDIVHAAVWNRNDDRMIYNLAYRDGATDKNFVKRFSVTGVTRDKAYDLTQGTEGSETLYLTANPNGQSEIITVHLSPKSRARKKVFEFDFSTIAIKSRGSKGNVLSRYRAQKIVQKQTGTSTLGGIDIWYDPSVGRLNTQSRGRRLGCFEGEDRILTISKDGNLRLTTFELTNQYDPGGLLLIEKDDPSAIVSVIYLNGDKGQYYSKRFETSALPVGKPIKIISDTRGSSVVFASTRKDLIVRIKYLKGRGKNTQCDKVNLEDMVATRAWKAVGNRFGSFKASALVVVEAVEPEEEAEKKTPSKARKTKKSSKKAQYQPGLFGE